MLKGLDAVILNYNDSIRVSLASKKLLDLDLFENIVVVDNNSKPEQYNILKNTLDKDCILLQSKNNNGYASGINNGLRYLEDKGCRVVLTLNPDMEITRKGIIDCYSFLLKHSDIAACSTQMKAKGKTVSNYYDLPSLKTSMLNWIYSTINPCFSKKQYDGYFTAGYIRESAAFYNYGHFKEIGFYDETFFLYEEGPSSAQAFKRLGYKEAIVTDGEYSVHNHIGKTMNRYLFSLFRKSRFHYLEKYCGCNRFQIFLVNLVLANIFMPRRKSR